LLRADHVATLGVRARHERLKSPESPVGGDGDGFEAPAIDADAYQFSPFGQLESLIGASWSLVLGLSIDRHEQYGAQLNPRATLTWRPLDGLRMSVTSGRGFRAPDLLQLFDVDVNNVVIVGDRVTGYAIVGNPDLDPELDFGNTLFAEYTGLRGVRVTADAFRHDLDDLIANELVCTGPTTCKEGFENPLPDLDGLIFSYRNVSAALTQGANLALSFLPLDWRRSGGGPHAVEVSLGAGYLYSENESDIAGERGNDLPFRPRVRFLPSVEYRNSSYDSRLRIWGEYDGKQYSDLGNTDSGEVDPYWLWSFKLAQGFGGIARLLGGDSNTWLEPLGLFVQGDNVFDAEAGDVLTVAGPSVLVRKRNFMAGVRFEIGD
jgi:outer membrane receptor for ferrienterochelin and colicins